MNGSGHRWKKNIPSLPSPARRALLVLSLTALSALTLVQCQGAAPHAPEIVSFAQGLEPILKDSPDCNTLAPALNTYITEALADEALVRALRQAARSGTRYDSADEEQLTHALRLLGKEGARCQAHAQMREARTALDAALGK